MSSFVRQIGISAIMVSAVVGASPTAAQAATCAPRDAIIERLKIGYGEGPAGFGIQSSGQLIEIWAAPGTGTWTVLMSRPDGKTCVVATGTDWQHLELKQGSMGVPG